MADSQAQAETAQAETAQAETAQAETAQAETAQADPTRKARKVRKAAPSVPSVRDADPETVTVGTALSFPAPAPDGTVGTVQAVKHPRSGAFALLTNIPEPGSVSGVAGMFGTAGNGTDGATRPGCAGHGKSLAPILSWTVGIGDDAATVTGWYAFVGTIPAEYGAIDPVGRRCRCARAVRADGTLYGSGPTASAE